MQVTSVTLFLKIIFLSLASIVVSLMLFYVRGLTSNKTISIRPKIIFYSWIGFLIVVGIFFHFLTAWKVPWVHWELKRAHIKPDREIYINVREHQFFIPKVITVKKDEVIKFKVFSEDLTYGFGVFRKNGGLEFQMQVVPGHLNEIIWKFQETGKYSVRSTEYAGPKTLDMYRKDAIEVLP